MGFSEEERVKAIGNMQNIALCVCALHDKINEQVNEVVLQIQGMKNFLEGRISRIIVGFEAQISVISDLYIKTQELLGWLDYFSESPDYLTLNGWEKEAVQMIATAITSLLDVQLVLVDNLKSFDEMFKRHDMSYSEICARNEVFNKSAFASNLLFRKLEPHLDRIFKINTMPSPMNKP